MRMLSYEELFTGFKKGMRNGNWKMLRLKKILENHYDVFSDDKRCGMSFHSLVVKYLKHSHQ